MFLTVTPNPCIERTLRLKSFQIGAVHRAASQNVREDAGGKGVNAARVAASCGANVIATGWIGRERNAWLREKLEADHVRDEFLRVAAPTRVATNILAGDDDVISTEIIENGGSLTLDDGTRLLKRFEELVATAKLCALCGSYPPATLQTQSAFDAFSTLLLRTSLRANVPMLIDGHGAAFLSALKSRPAPWCIKPNVKEAAAILQRDITTPTEERRAVMELLRLGPRVVLLSCGARGCYVGLAQQVWFLPSPQVRTVSSVGSGDSLVGAFAARYLELSGHAERERVLEAARFGVAAGAVNATKVESAFVARQEIEAMLPDVKVQTQVLALLA